jgi:ATP-dependent helicase/nuclease subunit B
MGIEWPRFIRVAAFMIEWEAERRFVGFQPLAIETSGVLAINAPEGPFALSARVDRIDLRPDGALDIIDFKTGTLPGVKEVRCGFAPQLPLQAVMAARGKFENVPGHEPGEMLYLRINGGREPGNERSIVDKPGTEEALDLAEDALDDLSQWIIDFDNPDTAYLSQPRAKFTNRYGDYDHLARRKEWASAQDEAEGNS